MLLLRFYEDLPPREVALRTGAPVETVRSQIKRALAMLRTTLERDEHGAPRSLPAMLAPFAGRPSPSSVLTTQPAGSFTFVLKLGVCVAGVLLGAAWWLTSPRDGAPGSFDTAMAPASPPVVVPASIDPNPTQAAVPHSPALAEQRADAGQVGAGPRARVMGRVLHPNGTPAADVPYTLHGWSGNDERMRAYQGEIQWEDISGRTDRDGRFDVEFTPPPPYQFTFALDAPNHVAAMWRWPSVPIGQAIDLGEETLTLGAILTGKVCDTENRAISLPISIEATGGPSFQGFVSWSNSPHAPLSLEPDLASLRQPPRANARVRPDEIHYRIERVPVGAIQVIARIGHTVVGPRLVMTRPGAETVVDFEWDPNSAGAAVAVDTLAEGQGLLGSSQVPDPSRVTLVGGEGTIHARGGEGGIEFDSVPDGEHTLNINDPRFQPTQIGQIRPGDLVRATVRGNSGAIVTVVDRSTGAALDDCTFSIRIAETITVPLDSALIDGRYQIGGLIAGDNDLSVSRDGYMVADLPVTGLQPGEQRSLTVELVRGGVVDGIVFSADGATPIAGAHVELYAAAEEADGPDSTYRNLLLFTSDRRRSRVEFAATVADDAGHFRFARLRPGIYVARATLASGERHATDPFTIDAERPTTNLRVVMPRHYWIRGTARIPRDANGDGLVIQVTGPDHEQRAAPIADGNFALGPIPPGRYALALTTHNPLHSLGPLYRHGYPTFTRPIREVHVTDADQELDLDLTADMPGRVEVRVRVDGEPRDGLVAAVTSLGSSDANDDETDCNGYGITDSAGVAQLSPVPAGTYELTIRSTIGSWSITQPASVVVGASRTTVVDVDIELVIRTVRCVGPDSEPLRDAHLIRMMQWGKTWSGSTAVADHEGLLTLTGPRGTLRLCLPMESSGSAYADIDWQPGSGVLDVTFDATRR